MRSNRTWLITPAKCWHTLVRSSSVHRPGCNDAVTPALCFAHARTHRHTSSSSKQNWNYPNQLIRLNRAKSRIPSLTYVVRWNQFDDAFLGQTQERAGFNTLHGVFTDIRCASFQKRIRTFCICEWIRRVSLIFLLLAMEQTESCSQFLEWKKTNVFI